jgi:hypothetical protein
MDIVQQVLNSNIRSVAERNDLFPVATV